MLPHLNELHGMRKNLNTPGLFFSPEKLLISMLKVPNANVIEELQQFFPKRVQQNLRREQQRVKDLQESQRSRNVKQKMSQTFAGRGSALSQEEGSTTHRFASTSYMDTSQASAHPDTDLRAPKIGRRTVFTHRKSTDSQATSREARGSVDGEGSGQRPRNIFMTCGISQMYRSR
jgi:hypothetical protein